MSGSCRSAWRGCRQRGRRRRQRLVSPSFTPFPEGAGGGWPAGVCRHLGEGEGPRLGHAAPLPSSITPRALRLSLLLPAVTGVPSPRATDPPSHVRPLFFPCVKPTAQSTDPIPVSWSKFRVHPTYLGFHAADSLHSNPTSTRFPQFRPLAKSRPGSPSIPCPTSAPLAIFRPPPRQLGGAGLRSGHLSLLSPARWPPGRGSGPVPAGGAKPHAPPPPAALCQGTSGCSHPRVSHRARASLHAPQAAQLSCALARLACCGEGGCSGSQSTPAARMKPMMSSDKTLGLRADQPPLPALLGARG